MVPSLQESCVLGLSNSRFGVFVFFHGHMLVKIMQEGVEAQRRKGPVQVSKVLSYLEDEGCVL